MSATILTRLTALVAEWRKRASEREADARDIPGGSRISEKLWARINTLREMSDQLAAVLAGGEGESENQCRRAEETLELVVANNNELQARVCEAESRERALLKAGRAVMAFGFSGWPPILALKEALAAYPSEKEGEKV